MAVLFGAPCGAAHPRADQLAIRCVDTLASAIVAFVNHPHAKVRELRTWHVTWMSPRTLSASVEDINIRGPEGDRESTLRWSFWNACRLIAHSPWLR